MGKLGKDERNDSLLQFSFIFFVYHSRINHVSGICYHLLIIIGGRHGKNNI